MFARCMLIACLVAIALSLDVQWKTNQAISGFSQADKDAIVSIHNSYRSAVDPVATNMLEVQWDDSIAAVAQSWAEECTTTHANNPSAGEWTQMGENLWWIYQNSYHELVAVEYWFDEREHFTYATDSCTGVCGHYDQVVTAEVEYIGCGITYCDPFVGDERSRSGYYIVCNYNEIRNTFQNQRPYLTGDVCSACPATAPNCRHRLCVPDSLFNSNQGYDGDLSVAGITRPDVDDGGDDNGGDDNGGDDDDGDDDGAITLKLSTCVVLLVLTLRYAISLLL